jgi:hypothetical protein
MSNYYVTETLEEAQAQEVADFIEFKAANPLLPAEYWKTTTAWSMPAQRLDGKWVRVLCPNSTATGRTIEAYGAYWFPEEISN